MNEREALDRIAALCDRVQPGWQQVVSVEAVRGILAEVSPEAGSDQDLAHLRPVAGVTIAPHDYDLVAEAALWHASTLDRMLSDEDAKRLREIAARLTRRD